jgi:hypothetical protein
MLNPYPDIFDDDEAERLQSNLGDKFEAIAQRVRRWQRGMVSGNWLALGLNVVSDGRVGATGSTHTREGLRKAVEEHILEDPGSWDPENIILTGAWLDISYYLLWKLVNEAQRAGINELEEQFFAMAGGEETGSTIGSTIEEAFNDAIHEWREKQKVECAS